MGSGTSKYGSDEIRREKNMYLHMHTDTKRISYTGSFICLDAIFTWQQFCDERLCNRDKSHRRRHQVNRVINDKVSLWQGDITKLEIDAIVNSAARPDKGQVNKLVRARAGDYYKAEVLDTGLGVPGEAMVTGGYKLPARYVINTLAPRSEDKTVLENCYYNSLNAARQNGLRVIAFPCIATKKRNCFPMEKATNIALETVRVWMENNHEHVDRVIFCVYGYTDYRLYRRLMQQYFPVGSDSGNLQTIDSFESVKVEETALTESDDSVDSASCIGAAAARPKPSSNKSQTLDDWRDQLRKGYNQRISLPRTDRKQTYKRIISIYNDSSIDLRCTPYIEFEGEDGVDIGALTREYFVLCLETITSCTFMDSPCFDGCMDHKLPTPSREHVKQGVFGVIGKVIAHSVLHGGMGIVGLSPAVVHLLNHDIQKDDAEESGVPVSVSDIDDLELRELLEIKEFQDLTQGNKQLMTEYMEKCNLGYMKINTQDNFNYMKQELMLYQVVHRRWPQIEALRHGMNALGLYSFLCENPSDANTRQVFMSCSDVRLTPDLIINKIKREHHEERIWGYFNRFLQATHQGDPEDINLGTLLQFWTGHPLLPVDHLTMATDPRAEWPKAESCALRLVLPGAHASYERFRQKMHTALKFGAEGFGEQ